MILLRPGPTVRRNKVAGPKPTTGVTAKRLLPLITRREGELMRRLYESEPHLTQTDSPLVQMLIRNYIKIQMFDEYFFKNGMYDEEGKIRDPYRVYFTCQKNTMRLSEMLGLSTESKIKLGIAYGALRQVGRLLEDEEDEKGK